jgi:hypothetical protein
MRKIALATVLLVAFGLAACRTAPVENVRSEPVIVGSGVQYTRKDVRDAIVRAGADLGWQMIDSSSGELIGTLNIRSHMAKVAIPYDKQSYSILYRDSTNLHYDGEDIHNNYNGWVTNLNNEIRVQLAAIGT